MAKKKSTKALLTGNKVIVRVKSLKDSLIQKGFGEKKEKELILDLKEALVLSDKGTIEIEDAKGNAFDFDELLKYASGKEKNFYTKFLVYEDLRTRGFVVKTGFKFGFDFRVYPRGKKMGEAHTQWVVAAVTQDDKFTMPELSRMVRLSGNIRAKILLAVVDSEDDINYYEIDRITP